MKRIALLIIVSLPLLCFSQSDSLLDTRDNRKYAISKINETKWMLDNLNFETDLSFSLNETQQAVNPKIIGRWYHLDEVSAVCPAGWQIPSTKDWIEYFNVLTKMKDSKLKLRSGKENIALSGYDDKVNLFDLESPLNIKPTGIFQGSKYLLEEMADYWIADIPTKNSVNDLNEFKKENFRPVSFIFKGKSHIHLYNGFTQIHSHDHHLDPTDSETLRRFMVRCVSYSND